MKRTLTQNITCSIAMAEHQGFSESRYQTIRFYGHSKRESLLESVAFRNGAGNLGSWRKVKWWCWRPSAPYLAGRRTTPRGQQIGYAYAWMFYFQRSLQCAKHTGLQAPICSILKFEKLGIILNSFLSQTSQLLKQGPYAWDACMCSIATCKWQVAERNAW